MSYYHRYRPQQFADLYGQEAVRTILTQALLTDHLGHAYLFAGTRGTGKTTTARLLAKAINCLGRSSDPKKPSAEPCNSCELCQSIQAGTCLDVIEIDAASNRGIDEIRQLQDQTHFRPQQAVKKIFIIDEVHMLTKEAFNALLKTLEEPPSYLVFILATTELHKVPATVISRCQRFDFQTPSVEAISQYLAMIAKQEKLKADAAAIHAVAGLARGSFRDASTLLEQLAHEVAITSETVQTVFGLPEDGLVDRYLKVQSGLSDTSLRSDLQAYFARGGNASAFLDIVFDRFGEQLSKGNISDPQRILSALVRAKYQLRYSPVAALPILALAEGSSTRAAQKTEVPAQSSPVAASQPKVVKPMPSVSPVLQVVAQPEKIVILEDVSDTKEAPAQSQEMVTIAVAEQVPPAELPPTELSELWQKALAQLLAEGESSLVAILRTAKPISYQSPDFTLGVQFQFHADHIAKQKNRGALEAVLTSLAGKPVRIEAQVQPADDLATVAEQIDL